MLTQEINERITATGPGTPAGEFLRRYWQPVGLSRDVIPGGQPKQLRIMSEDLVLFRVQSSEFKVQSEGRPLGTRNPQLGTTSLGLLGLHCSHRATSLAYGRVEDGGIRCPFHGWLYDIEGHCLQQPAETAENRFNDKIRHLAYPCQELGGLIWAYMGPPDKIPLLPRYEVLVREDGTRQASSYVINSNYLQNLEGTDATHFLWLHAEPWSQLKHRLFALTPTQIAFWPSSHGLLERVTNPNMDRGEGEDHFAHFVMPAGFLRMDARGSRIVRYHSWYVPMDDTHTYRAQVGFAPLARDGSAYTWRPEEDFAQPGPENDYFRDYYHVDTISGIPGHSAPGTATKGYLCQDNMANETPGPIVDRSTEHLGASDQLLVAIRQEMLAGIKDVEEGRDPKHILRDPADNVLIQLATGEEELAPA